MTATRRSSATSNGWAPSSASGRSGRPSYFSANAASWDQIRSLHAPDGSVEAAIRKLVGKRPFQAMLDLGTGTGRLLEMLGAALPARRRHRHVARDAGGRPRQSRQGRGPQCAGPAGRHLRAAGRARRLRPRHHPPGAALSRRSAGGDPRGGAHAAARRPADHRRLRLARAGVPARGARACRLGFSDRQIADWFAEAGLDLEETLSSSSRAPAPTRR